MSNNFELDARLQKDTFFITDLSLCSALLMNDQRYPWVILVPRQAGLRELHQLDESGSALLWQESGQVARALMSLFDGDKLNVAALGNVVEQLHVHHVLRRSDDPAWPGPVWGHSPAQPYSADDAQGVVQSLSRMLSGAGQG